MCSTYILTYILNSQKSNYIFSTIGASSGANNVIETNVEERMENEDTIGRDNINAQRTISLSTTKVLLNSEIYNVY